MKKQLNSVNKQIADVNNEIATTDNDIAKIDQQISAKQSSIQSVENQLNGTNNTDVYDDYGANGYQNYGSKDNSITNYTPAAVECEAAQTQPQKITNPFLAISYDLGNYSNMTEALEAIATGNEQSASEARTVTNNNKQEIRNMFQDLIA